MKKLLLVVGVVCLIVAVLFLAFAVLSLLGYRSLMDGSAEVYQRLHRRMVTCFVLGGVFAAAGAGCIVLRSGVS